MCASFLRPSVPLLVVTVVVTVAVVMVVVVVVVGDTACGLCSAVVTSFNSCGARKVGHDSRM